MQAVRFQGVGRPAIVKDVPKPRVRTREVLIKIGGAGASDLHLIEDNLGFTGQFTLEFVKTEGTCAIQRGFL
jgi:D-arabinose 1-dehydrogenase-like Zn-dependent alcohol dehydrogenase